MIENTTRFVYILDYTNNNNIDHRWFQGLSLAFDPFLEQGLVKDQYKLINANVFPNMIL
jgi:hypothetical protein